MTQSAPGPSTDHVQESIDYQVTVDLNRPTEIPCAGLFVLIQPTDRPKRFRVRITSSRPKRDRVCYRKHKSSLPRAENSR